MVTDKEVLAIIPARGGSKSMPRKNIKLFCGFPLIAWSIAAAKQSKQVTRVIVSTDDKEIAATAREFGAQTPFLRPTRLAQDDTRDLPVFVHALEWLDKHEGYKVDVVVQLRPTSPIRPIGLVDKAVETLLSLPNADSVRGVVPASQNPYKMWRIEGRRRPMRNLLGVAGIDEPYNEPRQVLPPVYWQTGHIDAIRRATIEKGSMSGGKVYPLIIDGRFAMDIDTPRDWERAEWFVYSGGLDMVRAGRKPRPTPKSVKLIVSDFDGVITDNRVFLDKYGIERVSVWRSDSMRIRDLRKHGIEFVILSSEPNPVVSVRAKKMGVSWVQGVDVGKKGEVLKKLLFEKKVDASNVVYIGNDLNDLPCFKIAGWAVAVADAYPEVLQAADYVLTRSGGYGAVRELIDILISKQGHSENL